MGEEIVAGAPFQFAVKWRSWVNLPAPAGVDPDFIVTDNEGIPHLVVGGVESYLANNPNASQLEWRNFVSENGDELDYYLHVPENYDRSQAYPLVLSLHRSVEAGDNASPILPYNGAYEFLKGAANYDYFVVIPQLPHLSYWWDSPIREILLALVITTQEEYPVDPARTYIIGLSLGALGLWGQVSSAPDTYAAGLALAGAWAHGPLDVTPIAHIPFWVFHDAEDTIVPPSESRSIVAALEEAGGTVKYTEYEGAGHWIWVRTYTDPEVIDWLFSQHKS